MANHVKNPLDMSVWLRSCKKEILEPIKGDATGEIPKWLNGVLIQNGAGLWGIGDTSFKHLFDCLALLHRYEIKDGEITYQSRFLQSESYKKNVKANRIVVSEFGTTAVCDPCESVFSRVRSTFYELRSLSDNTAVAAYPIGDELYCFGEFPFIHKVDQNTLETVTRKDFRSMSIIHHSSHPHLTNDGSVYTLATTLTKSGFYHNIVCFPSEPHKKIQNGSSMVDKARVVAHIPARWYLNPSYMHSFGISNNYFVIIEQPLNLHIPTLVINKLRNKPIISSIRCYKNELSKISLITRLTGKLTYEFYAENLFYFHVINCYEYDGHVVLDICTVKDGSLIECLYKESLKNAANIPNYAEILTSRPVRYVLPLIHYFKNVKFNENLVKLKNTHAEAYLQPNGKVLVKPETLCEENCETPTINYSNYSGKVYRYFYAMGLSTDTENGGVVVKVDTDTKTVQRWSEDGCCPTEPIFVQSPNSDREDDGVVLVAVLHNSDDKKVSLVVLDAETFTEVGRTTFVTPSPVPKSFHGCFLKQ